MKKIGEKEVAIIGSWVLDGDKMSADTNCQRILTLTTTHLHKIGNDKSGWNTLYKDPDDGRHWELIYPQSDQHGGGAPSLVFISEIEVKKKY